MAESKFPHQVHGQYYKDGVLLGSFFPEEMIPMVQQFEMFQDDCVIISYPKSGSTWLKEIVYLVANNADIDKANQTWHLMRTVFLDHCYPLAGGSPATALAKYKQHPRPRIIKAHASWRYLPTQIWEKKIKTIFIMRNPKDVAVSYYHFYQSSQELGNYKGSWDTFFDMFMAGEVFYGSWIDYILEWWQKARDCDHVLVLKYEDMIKDHHGTIRKISEFLGKSLSEEQIQNIEAYTSFQSMRDNPMTSFAGAAVIDASISPFYRKGKIGDWKNYFSEAQSKQVDEKCQRIFQAGLEFQFE